MDVTRLHLSSVHPGAWVLLAVFFVIALAKWLPNPDEPIVKPKARIVRRVTAGDLARRPAAAKKPHTVKRVKR